MNFVLKTAKKIADSTFGLLFQQFLDLLSKVVEENKILVFDLHKFLFKLST